MESNEAGAEEGLRAEAYNNKQGQFQGIRFYAGEEKFKASGIGPFPFQTALRAYASTA